MLSPSSTKDRYRPIFCQSKFYFENQSVFNDWKKRFKNLSPIEKVQAWVLGLSLLRRPKDWYGGKRADNFLRDKKSTSGLSRSLHPLTLSHLVAHSPIEIPPKLNPEISLVAVLDAIKIKALPDSSLRSLCHAGNGSYPLKVISHVPAPVDLLSYQLNNERVISFNEDFETWPEVLYHGRDFLSFMIHDLIHADHFFGNNQNRLGQLGFYRCIEKILNGGELQMLLERQPFKDGFEYIISDMNSHPVHLFKTLHAQLKMHLNQDSDTQRIWKIWTSVWCLSNPLVDSALQKINTQLFSDTDALDIESFSIALGHTNS